MIAEQTMTSQGVLELHPKGFGFLRNPTRHYAAQAGDPYVPAPLIQKHSLREGMLIGGVIEPPRKGASGPRLTAVARIEDQEPRQERLPRRRAGPHLSRRLSPAPPSCA